MDDDEAPDGNDSEMGKRGRSHKSASHQGGSQLAGGVFIFLCIIRRHLRWVRADSGGNAFSRNMVARQVGPCSQGETIFSQNTGGPSGGSPLSGGGIIILHIIRRHFWWVQADSGGNVFSRNTVARPVGPSSQGK